MYQKIVEKNVDIVMNTNILTHTGNQISEYIHPSMPQLSPDGGGYIANNIGIDKSFCAIWMRLFKRDFIEKNKIRFKPVNMAEDNVFHYIAHLHADTIFAFCSSAAYHYIIHDDSLTGVVKANNQRDYFTMKAYDLIFDYLKENNLLEKNKARLFNISGFFKVDTPEKYLLYKTYFRKVQPYLESSKELYNELDTFLMNSILESDSFEDYKQTYPVSVAMSYLKFKKKV